MLLLLSAATPQSTAYSEASQVNRGKQIYQKACASCHGATMEGQGGTPRLAGSGSRVRSNYVNAQQLYEFISVAMPFDRPGQLKKEEYWDLAAFLWYANGVDPGPMTVGPDTASKLTWDYKPGAAPSGSTGAAGSKRPEPASVTEATGVWVGAGCALLVAGGIGTFFVRRRKSGKKE